MDALADLLERQDDVIARRQVLSLGLPPSFVARRLRRRDWVAVHPGVHVAHTGPLTPRQREWAALLACWPAALGGWSAVRAHEGPGRRSLDATAPVDVLVPTGRAPVRLPGVRVRETRRFAQAVDMGRHPPRQRYDDAIVELADRAGSALGTVAVLSEACGSRRTTAARLLEHAASMSRLRRRSLVEDVLRDIADGTCSVLEHAYLTHVERPHGLPRGLRQVHERDDAGRSMDTLRLGYAQVLDRPCRTATKVAAVLQQRGWSGALTPCPACDAQQQRDRPVAFRRQRAPP